MNRKREFWILLLSVLLLLICSYIFAQIRNLSQQTYNYYGIYYCLTFIPLGLCLGLIPFLKEKDKKGTWSFDYLYFGILGILLLYGMLYVYTMNFFIMPDSISLALVSTPAVLISSVLFGYVFMSSFYKKLNQ